MSNVITYFDSFISRTILLWLVNIENIFKFFINNHRSTDILLKLLPDSLTDPKCQTGPNSIQIGPDQAYSDLEKKIDHNYDKILEKIFEKIKKYLSDYIWYIFPTDKISKFEPEPKTFVTLKTAEKLFNNEKWIDIHKKLYGLKDGKLKTLFNIRDIDRIKFFIKLFRANDYNNDGLDWKAYISKLETTFSL